MRYRTMAIMLLGTNNLYAAETGRPAQPQGRRLREIVAEKAPDGGIQIGVAIQYDRLKGRDEQILKEEFGYLTPANEFKQSYIHPKPGQWQWEQPDAWIKFAKENDQVVRVHGPISPQCSLWAREPDRTPEELEANLREYMSALCRRYNGHPNVKWIDVVNETVLDSGKWHGPKPGPDAWQNPWPRIGYVKDIPAEFPALKDGVPLYIIQAFEVADRNAPDLKLVLNQQGNLSDNVWARIKDLILYLRSRGLRVDGVGWQAHIKYGKNSDFSKGGKNIRYLGELIDWAHANGLEFHVTENNIHDDANGPDRQDEYTEIFGAIQRTLLSKRDSGVVTWNMWGLNDRAHFKNKRIITRSMWSEDLKPKKSYYEAQRILESLPASRRK